MALIQMDSVESAIEALSVCIHSHIYTFSLLTIFSEQLLIFNHSEFLTQIIHPVSASSI